MPGACEWLAGRAGCRKSARPDPWEPWVGNRPGRPGIVAPGCYALDVIGQEVRRSLGIALLDGGQDARDFTHRRHRDPAARRFAGV